MFKYFKGSFIVTVLGLLAAFFWGKHIGVSAIECVYIASILAVLEVSLSFDNAVVNATKLEKMTPQWRHRFITWGILIAVFGMRFIFPLTVVSIFSHLNMASVLDMALHDSASYSHYLEITHAPIVTFGGAFLFMLFMDYFTEEDKICWIKPIEHNFQKLSKVRGICTITTLLLLGILYFNLGADVRQQVFLSGIYGVITYLLIDGFSEWLEKKQEDASFSKVFKYSGLVSFLYLELIDASFSLDGVLGAFALSQDIVIITLGLFIGAMFVRSLTIMLVEKKTLQQFLFLEHGAHWAIGTLAILMFVSTKFEVPEVVTGTLGLAFILSALFSSIVHNKKNNI